MDMMEAIRARHSVREYEDRPIEQGALGALRELVGACADESGLDIQLVEDNPEVFDLVARFGIIRGARTSIAFVTSGNETDEQVGYWGQRIVLEAQRLGLNTCWCAMCARRKSKARRGAGQRVRLVIAVGHGETPGRPRRTKAAEELSSVECGQAPAWFALGVEAAQLAPTAMNNQHFHITLRPDAETVAIDAPSGALDRVDLGIVKRNFEEAVATTGAAWRWEEG